MPTDDPGQVFRTCISSIRSSTLKRRLTAIEPIVVAAAQSYVQKASTAALHTVDVQTIVGSVTRDEMSKVYEQKMVNKQAPGRPIYNKILLSPPNGTCPLCGLRKVSTVDHHLPKAHHPSLAVVPANLVPACMECNKAKGDTIPDAEDKQTIHPYFDDIDGVTWLVAEVVETAPPAIRYFVDPPARWSDSQARRVANHFHMFGLARLYASNAADELENIRHAMEQLLKVAGSGAVRSHLLMIAESCAKAHSNSWKTAMYRALADNGWYCDGGFHV